MQTREIFWNIPLVHEIVLYILAGAAVALFAYGIVVHLRRILSGKRLTLSGARLGERLKGALADIVTHRHILRRHALGGMMHLLIFWGMAVLFAGTLIVSIEYDLFQKLLGRQHGLWVGPFFLGYELVLDGFGTLLIVGLAIGLVRRYGLKRSQLRRRREDLILPLWLLLIGVSGFCVEGLRLAATSAQLGYSPGWSPAGLGLSRLWADAGIETLRSWHLILWWFHGVLALAGLACLPFAPRVMHLLTAAVNLFFKDLRPRGRMAALDVEGAFERDEVLGFETLADLTRKDLLDVASCTECGRCELNCPANIAGKLLSPREIILGLRGQMRREFPAFGQAGERHAILETSISPEAIGACTTCMACVEACPAGIDPLGKILELRRSEVMMQDRYPETFAEVFAGTEKRGNPWNEHPTARLNWAKGLEIRTMAEVAAAGESVEFLFWVGCSAAFDPRNQKIARSVAKILEAAGIAFAVLGEEERCTGDPARRMGHEYLFQMQAEMNVRTLSGYTFDRILTLCPHCYNTLKNEYPHFGGHYRVVHHSELIRDLLDAGRIETGQGLDGVVTYHDSCYLGRYNRIFDAPRDVLARLPGLRVVEMERSREYSMCCGAGGGLTWIEEDPQHRVNDRRVEQARAAVDPERDGRPGLIATACPFCMTMLEDGLAAGGSELRDKDIAELVVEAMGLQV